VTTEMPTTTELFPFYTAFIITVSEV